MHTMNNTISACTVTLTADQKILILLECTQFMALITQMTIIFSEIILC